MSEADEAIRKARRTGPWKGGKDPWLALAEAESRISDLLETVEQQKKWLNAAISQRDKAERERDELRNSLAETAADRGRWQRQSMRLQRERDEARAGKERWHEIADATSQEAQRLAGERDEATLALERMQEAFDNLDALRLTTLRELDEARAEVAALKESSAGRRSPRGMP